MVEDSKKFEGFPFSLNHSETNTLEYERDSFFFFFSVLCFVGPTTVNYFDFVFYMFRICQLVRLEEIVRRLKCKLLEFRCLLVFYLKLNSHLITLSKTISRF